MVPRVTMEMAALKRILVRKDYVLETTQRHVLLQINAMLLEFAILQVVFVLTQWKQVS
jgi:hypothetical protein